MIELQDPDCIVLSQPLHRHPAHRARSRAGHSCEQQLVGRLTRALDATAQVPPPHVQFAPTRLLGVGDARSSLSSLLSAAVAAAQSITTTSLAAGLAQGCGVRLPRRPRAGADARGVGDTLSPLLLSTATAVAPLAILFQRDASAHSPPCRVLGTAVHHGPGSSAWGVAVRFGATAVARRTRRSAARSTPRLWAQPKLIV